MIAQVGRFNLIAAFVALACFVVWVWQVKPQQVNAPQYNFSVALKPPLPPDARAGAQRSDHSLAGSDQFQGEVVSPDGDDNDQSSRGKDDDDSDDEMNPEDQVYPI